MKILNILVLATLINNCAERPTRAEEVLGDYKWRNTPGSQAGVLVEEGTQAYLRIRNTNKTALRAQLLKIEEPPVSSQLYAVEGEVRYEGVEGEGFLEMWSIFPPEKKGGPPSQYFSRTLGASGDMGKITGRSEWRKFSLPFNMMGSAKRPERLEINLILPGAGQVDLQSLKLVQFSGSSFAAGSTTAWWSERNAGFLGAAGGIVLGCLGSLIAWMGANRKAPAFVIGATQALIALGGLLAMLFVAALASKQPFWVWYLPGLLAALLLIIMPRHLRRFRKSYAEDEMRRMVAADSVG